MCNFIRAHVICLFKASSTSVPRHQVLYCILLYCGSVQYCRNLLFCIAARFSGSFLSLFRFKSCFDCVVARHNGCVSKQSELPTKAAFLGSVGAFDFKSTYDARKCYVGALLGFERQPMTTSLNMSVFENRHALIMPVHVTQPKIFGLSL